MVEQPRPATETPAVRTYQQSVELSGRLSVRYQRNAAEEAVHGGFSWQQTPNHTAITLSSPLGQILAVIEVSPNRAILRQSGQPARAAADPDSLVADTLGWPLPIAGLRDWLQGFARDAQGRPWVAQPGMATAVVTQDGWHLSYVSWQESGNSLVPRRIDLTRKTAQAGQVAIRIVVDRWQTTP